MFRNCAALLGGVIHRGRVVKWSDRTGYGFIEKVQPNSTSKGQQLFVHFKDIVTDKTQGFKFLAIGQEVEFTEHVSASGYRAANVTAPGGIPLVSEERQRGNRPSNPDTSYAMNDRSLMMDDHSTTTTAQQAPYRRAKRYQPDAFAQRHWGSNTNSTAAAPVTRPHYTSGWTPSETSPYL